jgi:single-strand DNA-binding protein
MFNKTTIGGFLTRDIELRYTNGGTAIANTAIASTHKFTSNGEKREETMFIDITFFGKKAETVNQWLRKGSKILIHGMLKFDQWTDQQGQKRSKHTIIVDEFTFLDSKQDNSNAGASGGMPQSGQHIAGDGNLPDNAYGTPSYNPNNQYQPDGAGQANAQYQQSQEQQPPQQPSYQPQTSIPEYDIDDEDIPFNEA